jgi:hypothetical protein
VAVILRAVLRGGGPELMREHWPGPESSLAMVLRVIGYPGAPGDASDTPAENVRSR